MGQKRNGVTPIINRDGHRYKAYKCWVCGGKSTDVNDIRRCVKRHELMALYIAGKLKTQRGWVFRGKKQDKVSAVLICKDCGDEAPGRDSARGRCRVCREKYYAKLRLSRPSWRK